MLARPVVGWSKKSWAFHKTIGTRINTDSTDHKYNIRVIRVIRVPKIFRC